LTELESRTQLMTVARVRAAGPDIEVTFFESARIYRLQRANPAFEAALRDLHGAAASRARVVVVLATPHGEVIESVKATR
jgi:hypothetical protein